MSSLRDRMIQDLQIRNYSPRTIARYIDVLAQLSRHYGRSPARLSPEDVRRFLVAQVEAKFSVSKLKQIVCATRFLFRCTLGREFPDHLIPYPREERKLPTILSQEEVARLIRSAPSLRHRAILTTAYGTGGRVTELSRLKITDIDSSRMLLTFHHGKGNKDREVPLSLKVLNVLRAYWRAYRPAVWLFPGIKPDSPTSRDAIQNLVASAARRASLSKHISPHSLRHAYATHLLEAGVDIRILQQLLGHNSLRSTLRYAHITPASRKTVRESLDTLPALDLPLLTTAPVGGAGASQDR